MTDRATIVCATRGGEGSRAVRQRAIALALEDGCALVFLFVIDIKAIDRAGHESGGRALSDALQKELSWVGRALLEIARRRAKLAGVEAEIVIREGEVKEVITTFLKKRRPSHLLLGAPRGTTANVFGDDAVERFAEEISAASGVAVEVVRPAG